MHKFVNGEIGSNSTMLSLAQTSKSGKHGTGPQALTSDINEIQDKIKELKNQWKEFKPFLVGSGGVALAVGVIQTFTSLLILCSGPKVSGASLMH